MKAVTCTFCRANSWPIYILEGVEDIIFLCKSCALDLRIELNAIDNEE